MDLVYFIVLISTLIFVHELGHFIFAKLFGVKVLTFSFGFGPKVLRLRGRETEYCVSILPLGGYVKMLESSKTDIVLPEDRNRTFEALALYKRVIVVLAGPVMNLIFPVILYFSVFVGAGPSLPPTVGGVLPGHPADGVLEPGDRIMAVNGQEVGTFDEVKRIINRNPAKVIQFKVFRNNKHVDVEMIADEVVGSEGFDAGLMPMQHRQLGIYQRYGSVGIESSAPAAIIGVPDPGSPAHRAGLRTFDVISHIAGKRVRRFMDLEAELAANHGETVPVTYMRPVPVEDALGGLASMFVYEAGVVALTPNTTGDDLLSRTGMELADLYVSDLPEDSPLYAAGLRVQDRLLRLDDEPLPAWSTFKERVWKKRDQRHQIEWLSARDGRERSGKFRIHRENFTDEHGQTFALYRFRMQHWIPLAPEEFVEHPAPVRYALTKAVDETVDVTRFILVLLVRAAQGRISLDTLSGPITIYEVAGEEGRKGPDYFVWVMALISINLGLLNLLPIPVLDGGHLMFFTVEAVLRRPIPLRVREVAHLLGLMVIVFLMAVSFKNDVEKRWDVIRSHVQELIG
jgi:regulator of sigma E protease